MRLRNVTLPPQGRQAASASKARCTEGCWGGGGQEERKERVRLIENNTIVKMLLYKSNPQGRQAASANRARWRGGKEKETGVNQSIEY